MEIVLEGKKFHAGLKWDAFADRKDALEKAEDYKDQGYSVFVVKVGDKWQVCVSKSEKLRHPILATGFLHLVYGYYYIPLEKGVWVFLKGADGTVIHEGVYESLEKFEAENSERVLPFLRDGEGRKKISLAEGKNFRRPRQIRPVFLLLPLVGVFFLVVLFVVARAFSEPEVKVRKTAPPAPSAVSQPALPPAWGRLDLSCYEKFYQKAIAEGNGECQWELSPSQTERSYPPCESATRKLMIPGASLQWGQVSSYGERGEVLGYSFSLSGEFFAQDIKSLQDLPFTLLKLTISGNASRPQVSLSGVLLCVR